MKILSSILLIFNPISGAIMIASIIYSALNGGYWWIIVFPLIGLVIALLKFYFHTHNDECVKTKKWKWIGEGYMCSYYQNRHSGEIIEL